jgi:glycosyltransferase involved in cell wall biosynthesis
LVEVLEALLQQSLPAQFFEVLLIDNASDRVDLPALTADLATARNLKLRLLTEPRLGLSHARRCGILAASSSLLVLVDDDNLLDPDFLQCAVDLALSHPHTGCFGGRVRPRFEQPLLPWQAEFQALLALVDHGPQTLHFSASNFAEQRCYPGFAPVGAGMVLKRSAARAWMQLDAARPAAQRLSDRSGSNAASSGDNDIVLCALRSGFDVAYFPQLQLTHLIPSARLQRDSLGRLNRGIQCSWQRLLQLHGISPWAPLSRTGAWLRTIRAWCTYRAWHGEAHWVRWMGARGHFEGRVLPKIVAGARI